jgi:hypothetical protein
METKRKSSRLLLFAVAALLLLAVGTVETAKAEYVRRAVPSWDYSDPVEIPTEFSIKISLAYAYAYLVDDSAYMPCSADTFTAGWNGGGVGANAWGWGKVEFMWRWEGPPGSTPPGGTLYWRNDGDGTAEVVGYTDPGNGGSAGSVAGAEHVTRVDGWRTCSVSKADVFGYVTDDNLATGYASFSEWPPGTIHTKDTVSDPRYGWYRFKASWNGDWYEEETVPPGTSYVDAIGAAECECYSGGWGSGGGTDGFGQADATSSASLHASARFP